MKKESKTKKLVKKFKMFAKKNRGYISLAIAFLTFIPLYIFKNSTGLVDEMNHSILSSIQTVWWHDTLIAGTLGMFGVSMILMMINFHITLPILLAIQAHREMGKIRV